MKIIQSKLLNQFPNLIQGFTTKDNGNVAFHVGDVKSSVIDNHKNLAQLLKYDINTLIHMKQVHQIDIKLVDDSLNFDKVPTCDALITKKKNTPLMVMVADCSALLFYDAVQEVIAVVHAGRVGAFKNIVQTTLQKFKTDFQSKMEDIYVSISPSIKECCYEVGQEVKEEAESLNLGFAIHNKKDSFYLNISKILYKQLLTNGIKEKNIEFSTECTACNTQKYFSYRAEKKTGRFCGILMLT